MLGQILFALAALLATVTAVALDTEKLKGDVSPLLLAEDQDLQLAESKHHKALKKAQKAQKKAFKKAIKG